MKTILAIILALTLTACSTTTISPTTKQEKIAGVVESSLAIGLVPVFVNNPGYLQAAQGLALTLSSVTGVTSITPEGIAAMLDKTSIAQKDARMITALVMAAWDEYQRNYRAELKLRADASLFLRSVANGITRAIASTPK